MELLIYSCFLNTKCVALGPVYYRVYVHPDLQMGLWPIYEFKCKHSWCKRGKKDISFHLSGIYWLRTSYKQLHMRGNHMQQTSTYMVQMKQTTKLPQSTSFNIVLCPKIHFKVNIKLELNVCFLNRYFWSHCQLFLGPAGLIPYESTDLNSFRILKYSPCS